MHAPGYKNDTNFYRLPRRNWESYKQPIFHHNGLLLLLGGKKSVSCGVEERQTRPTICVGLHT